MISVSNAGFSAWGKPSYKEAKEAPIFASMARPNNVKLLESTLPRTHIPVPSMKPAKTSMGGFYDKLGMVVSKDERANFEMRLKGKQDPKLLQIPKSEIVRVPAPRMATRKQVEKQAITDKDWRDSYLKNILKSELTPERYLDLVATIVKILRAQGQLAELAWWEPRQLELQRLNAKRMIFQKQGREMSEIDINREMEVHNEIDARLLATPALMGAIPPAGIPPRAPAPARPLGPAVAPARVPPARALGPAVAPIPPVSPALGPLPPLEPISPPLGPISPAPSSPGSSALLKSSPTPPSGPGPMPSPLGLRSIPFLSLGVRADADEEKHETETIQTPAPSPSEIPIMSRIPEQRKRNPVIEFESGDITDPYGEAFIPSAVPAGKLRRESARERSRREVRELLAREPVSRRFTPIPETAIRMFDIPTPAFASELSAPKRETMRDTPPALPTRPPPPLPPAPAPSRAGLPSVSIFPTPSEPTREPTRESSSEEEKEEVDPFERTARGHLVLRNISGLTDRDYRRIIANYRDEGVQSAWDALAPSYKRPTSRIGKSRIVEAFNEKLKEHYRSRQMGQGSRRSR